MKYINILFLIILTYCAYSQPVNFSAYNNISDPNFRSFVELFPSGQLPITSEDIFGSDLVQLSIADIPDLMENNFLKIDGNYIMPKLYTLQTESGESTDGYGYFQPVLKLPTNGLCFVGVISI